MANHGMSAEELARWVFAATIAAIVAYALAVGIFVLGDPPAAKPPAQGASAHD